MPAGAPSGTPGGLAIPERSVQDADTLLLLEIRQFSELNYAPPSFEKFGLVFLPAHSEYSTGIPSQYQRFLGSQWFFCFFSEKGFGHHLRIRWEFASAGHFAHFSWQAGNVATYQKVRLRANRPASIISVEPNNKTSEVGSGTLFDESAWITAPTSTGVPPNTALLKLTLPVPIIVS